MGSTDAPRLGIPDHEVGRRRRVPALDAVRGIAIGLVLLRHAKSSLFGAGGIVGVELFFVLSGYLITSIIVSERSREQFSFKRFYINRALRLVPMLTVVVLVVGTTVMAREGRVGQTPWGMLVGGLYLGDFATAFSLPTVPELTHLWTLAIEEQFYLIWPALLTLFVWPRVSLGKAALASLVVASASLILTVALLNTPEPVYTLPTTWALALVAGCALGMGAIRLPDAPPAAWFALVAMCGLTLLPEAKDDALAYLLVVPFVALAAVTLITNGGTDRPIFVLRNPWLQWLGLVSYSAYLWSGPTNSALGARLGLPVTIALAAASYYLVERWFLRLKAR